MERGNVGTTAQEKAIAFSIDARLYHKAGKWEWYSSGSDIERIIGHTKNYYRLDRCFFKKVFGYNIKAILAGCGFNMRKP